MDILGVQYKKIMKDLFNSNDELDKEMLETIKLESAAKRDVLNAENKDYKKEEK